MGLQLKPLFGPHFNLALMTKAVKYILHNLKELGHSPLFYYHAKTSYANKEITDLLS